jgi:hypothetical protein
MGSRRRSHSQKSPSRPISPQQWVSELRDVSGVVGWL